MQQMMLLWRHLLPPENEVFLVKRTNRLCLSGLGQTQRGCECMISMATPM